MRPREKESESSELARKWNRLLYREGLRVYQGGREIPLPPEEIERFQPIRYPKRRHPRIPIPLDSLSKREQEVLHLLFFEGLSEREAATSLGISRNSVKGYKKEALKKLRERMEKP